jgi:DICT domain-containing protein
MARYNSDDDCAAAFEDLRRREAADEARRLGPMVTIERGVLEEAAKLLAEYRMSKCGRTVTRRLTDIEALVARSLRATQRPSDGGR